MPATVSAIAAVTPVRRLAVTDIYTHLVSFLPKELCLVMIK